MWSGSDRWPVATIFGPQGRGSPGTRVLGVGSVAHRSWKEINSLAPVMVLTRQADPSPDGLLAWSVLGFAIAVNEPARRPETYR